MSAPMKAKDFKPCTFCGKGVAHTGIPIFYRVSIESMGIDARNVQRADAMERYMGGAVALARVFEDPDIATVVSPARTVLVCQSCALESHPVAMLGEREREERSKESA